MYLMSQALCLCTYVNTQTALQLGAPFTGEHSCVQRGSLSSRSAGPYDTVCESGGKGPFPRTHGLPLRKLARRSILLERVPSLPPVCSGLSSAAVAVTSAKPAARPVGQGSTRKPRRRLSCVCLTLHPRQLCASPVDFLFKGMKIELSLSPLFLLHPHNTYTTAVI